MTTETTTCTKALGAVCGGAIRPSYFEDAPLISGQTPRPHAAVLRAATCERCGQTYADVVSVPMAEADFDMIGDRLSVSTRQEMQATATAVADGSYMVLMTEARVRDLAAKTANLGLLPLAHRFRQELNGLDVQRHTR
jgi:hypothetical protein